MADGRKIFGSFIIAIALFFFWPSVVGTWQQVSSMRASVAERQQLLDQRQTILANVQTAWQQFQSKVSDADGQKFTQLVPVSKNTAEVVSAIQDIANNSGLSLSDVHMTETQTGATALKTLAMTMDLAGSYTSLRSFLGSLEDYVRLLNVTTIGVTTDTVNAGTLRFTVRAEAYFLK